MLEVNILRKSLDNSFTENKIYVPQGECVKDEMKVMFYQSKGFRLGFGYTN